MRALFSILICTTIFLTGCEVYSGDGAVWVEPNSSIPVKDYSEPAHWIGPARRIDELVDLGSIDDPALHGDIVKSSQFLTDNANYEWFTKGRVRRLFAYGMISRSNASSILNLPDNFREYEFGLVEYKMKSQLREKCEADIAWWASEIDKSRRARSVNEPYKVPSDNPGNTGKICYDTIYDSSDNSLSDKYIVYSYIPEIYRRNGFGVTFTEIRDPSSRVVARSVICFSALGISKLNPNICKHNDPDDMYKLVSSGASQ